MAVKLSQKMTSVYGHYKRGETKPGRPCRSERWVKHGSQVFWCESQSKMSVLQPEWTNKVDSEEAFGLPCTPNLTVHSPNRAFARRTGRLLTEHM